MTVANYNASQPDLYNTCRIGWQLCGSKLSDFASIKAKYKPTLIDQNLADVEAADRLPDFAARKMKAQGLRMDLVPVKDEILAQFGLLKSYIDDAFPSAKRTLTYNAAGEGYVAKAKKENWGSVTALLSSAIPFIEEHLNTLVANENMPPAFLVNFKKLEQTFKADYTAWLAADKNTGDNTDTKVIANNAIYANLQAMLTDAQRIYANDPTTAKSFLFSTLLAQTHGIKNAGLAGALTILNTKTVLPKVTLTLKGTEKTIITDLIIVSDDKGRFEFSPLSSGTYIVVVECAGYETQTIKDVVINTGATTRLNIQMVAIVAVAAA